MKDRIDINLRIADVAISLNVKPQEEELLREAAKSINQAVATWRKRFPSSSLDEVRAMITLLFAKDYLALLRQSRRAEELLLSLEKTVDSLLLDGAASGPDITREESPGRSGR